MRAETEEDAAKLGQKIIEFYQKRGYKVISVPPISVEERVDLIVRQADTFKEELHTILS